MNIFNDRFKLFFIAVIIFNLIVYPILFPFLGQLKHINKFKGIDVEDMVEEIQERETFFFSSIVSDSRVYSEMAMGEEAIAPYKYRMLFPCAISAFSELWFGSTEHFSIQNTTIWLNLITVFTIFLLSITFFKKFTDKYAILISLFIISLPAIFKTFPLMLLEIPSMLFLLLLLMNLKRPLVLLLLLVLSSFVKEVFVFSFFLVINQYLLNKQNIYIIISTIPIFLFLLIRYFFNDDLLSVNYGWELSKGEFDMKYINWAFASWKISILTFLKIVYVLLPLTLYFLLPKNRDISDFIRSNIGNFMFLTSIIFAALFLSASLVRPWGILTLVSLYMIFSYKKQLIDRITTHA